MAEIERRQYFGHVAGHRRNGDALVAGSREPVASEVERDHTVRRSEVPQLIAPHVRAKAGSVQQQQRRAFAPFDQVRLASVPHDELAVHDVVGHRELRIVGRGRVLVPS